MLRILLYLLLAMPFAFPNSAAAQAGVLNPADPDVVFTATTQPALPTYNNLSKWGHTKKLTWSGSTPFDYGYKSYYFKGMSFRLKFPKTYQHNVADGKKYPVFFFLHGLGERGDVYDNEYQLLHGGQGHANKVNDGTFDGFLIYTQSQSGFHAAYFPKISELIDTLVKYVKADIDRVVLSGLSSGGQSAWDFLPDYAQDFAGALPISAAQAEDMPTFNKFITIPIWTANGGLDGNPDPGAVTTVVNYYRNLGGKIRQTLYPTQGHGCWNSFWAEPDYYSTLSTYHKANPLVFFGRTEFCAGDAISVRMGVHPGFNAYEWQKDGVTIGGANRNEYTATQYGSYRARFKRTATSAWSEWSPAPVVVQQKVATVTPPIQVKGLRSKILPAPDGSTTVPLMVPSIYQTYEWRRVSDNALVSDTSILAAAPGAYKVKVMEQYGCSSSFTEPFVVLPAAGPARPDAPSNLSAAAVSNSAIRLDWNDNPGPVYNETGFEIYRGTKAGGPYTLLAVTAADVINYSDNGLNPNTAYYYVIRAINGGGASDATAEAGIKTATDTQQPTAPTDLRVTETTRFSVGLDWEASTDDLGVVRYDVYVNGAKAYSTTETAFTVFNLTQAQAYTFTVKARDFAGNVSPGSNQVAAQTILRGLNYKYYHGTWSTLPNFTTLTPVYTGTSANTDVNLRSQTDGFAFLWEGYINIPVSGTYYFRLRSDDGSRLWLGSVNGSGSPYSFSGNPIINHDGTHSASDKNSAALTLTAGIYPIAVAYFDRNGGDEFSLSWYRPQSSGFVTIPNSAFQDAASETTLPAAPSNLVVTTAGYNKINLNWTDNSSNESGFELWRSTSFTSGYAIVGSVGANKTSLTDSFQLAPATTYYYKLRAVGATGESSFIPVNNLQARWDFNNDYTDASGNGRTLTPNNGPTFSSTDKKEGTHALDFDGNNDDVTIPSVAGDYLRGGYTAKTVAFWMKADVTNSNRAIFDLGGSDDGLAMTVYSNYLIAGISSNNTRRNMMTAYNSTAWNHIALVYSASTLKMYVNASLKATLSLPFTSVLATNDASMIGDDVGTNALNTTLGQFDGKMDNFWVLGTAVSDAEVAQLMNNNYQFQAVATTLPLPQVPAAPTQLQAAVQSTSAIALNWTDNSSNETSFDVWRSLGTEANYRLLTSLPAGTTSYTDASLFANVTYYYKVLAKGIGGSSAFSNAVSKSTGNNAPVLQSIANLTMRYNSSRTQAIAATDADREALTLTVQDLPSFATYTAGANGAGSITFSPDATAQGVYPITAIVADTHGGGDTLSFDLTVNDNYVPVIASVADIEAEENKSVSVALSATDEDMTDVLQWSATGLPAFATFASNTDGTATISVNPNFAQAGNYPVTLTIADEKGGASSQTFAIKVTNIEPANNKWLVNIQHNQLPGGDAPWNNVNTLSAANLKDQTNTPSSVGLQFLTGAWNTYNGGTLTGGNTGVFPDNVLQDYYYFGIFGAPETVSFKLTGLDTAYRYNLSLHAGSSWNGVADNGSTVFTINDIAQTLYTQNNTQNTANFTAQKAAADGSLTVTMSKAPGSPVGYLNGFVLEKVFDDGTLPITPANLQAVAGANGSVNLSWTDVAYNELRYDVYRATSIDGQYTLLNEGANNGNATGYADTTTKGKLTYFYKVAAVNTVGTSALTEAVTVTTANKAPVVNALGNAYVKSGQSISISFTATDDAGETLSATISNLPAFAQVVTNSNGNGTISFSPVANDLGIYKDIKIEVTDNYGGVTERTFDLAVSDAMARSVYINLAGEFGTAQAKPWNNLISFPYGGYALSNLRDDQDGATSFGFRLIDQWTQSWKGGMVTSGNLGVYPDNVIQTSIYDGSGTTRRLQFIGLDQTKQYNIVVLSSNNAGFDATFTLASGSQSRTFNARYNSNSTVQLNGLIPDASGVIEFSMTKAAGASYMFLNAVVLQEYDKAITLLRPIDMLTEVNAPGKINLSWADRSTGETGFQIWRATSGQPYTLFATTAANVSAFVDSTSVANTRYYYKVRAMNNSVGSDFSNTANALIGRNRVLVNFNLATPQAAPWNNTNNTPQMGAGINDLKNISGNSTGFSMALTNNWGGYFDLGMTGGILPDNVMLTSWWIEGNSQPGTMRLSNLDQSKRYRIGFMGSSSWEGDFTASYTINGKTVYLNSFKNNSKIVYLDDVVTNSDGEVDITMGYLTSTRWSFLSAIIIEAYDDDKNAPGPVNNVIANGTRIAAATKAVEKQTALPEVSIDEVKAFPNPFGTSLTVNISVAKAGQIALKMYSLNGSLVLLKNLGGFEGSRTVTLNAADLQKLSSGAYILQVSKDGIVQQNIKLIKY